MGPGTQKYVCVNRDVEKELVVDCRKYDRTAPSGPRIVNLTTKPGSKEKKRLLTVVNMTELHHLAREL